MFIASSFTQKLSTNSIFTLPSKSKIYDNGHSLYSNTNSLPEKQLCLPMQEHTATTILIMEPTLLM